MEYRAMIDAINAICDRYELGARAQSLESSEPKTGQLFQFPQQQHKAA